MRFLITLDLPIDEIWQNPEILVPVKIWIKIDIFNHSGPGKAEIWQNADILSQVEIWLIIDTSKNPCYAQATWDRICLKKQNKNKQTNKNKTKQKK